MRMRKITIQIMILFDSETKIAVDERYNEKWKIEERTGWFFEFDDERNHWCAQRNEN